MAEIPTIDNTRFDKIFWFVCFLVMAVFVIDVAVFFLPIAPTGQKYVDNNLPILNTGAMMAGIYYLLGGNPKAQNAGTAPTITQTGDSPTNNLNQPPTPPATT